MADSLLSGLRHDALVELLNISVGAAANVLSQMSRSEIRLSVPELRQIQRREAVELIQESANCDIVSIVMRTDGFISGDSMLIFSEQSSLSLVKAILAEQVPLEMLSELEEEALTEVGNVVLNSCLATFTDLLGKKLITSVPTCCRGTAYDVLGNDETEVLFLSVLFQYEQGEAQGYITLMFNVATIQKITESIDLYLEKMGLILPNSLPDSRIYAH